MTTASPSSPSLAVLERFSSHRILPVIVIDDPNDAIPLAQALSGGGLPCPRLRCPASALP